MRFRPLKIRDSWVVLLIAVVVFALTATADAQTRRSTRPAVKSKYKVGQKVEFDFLGKIRQGEVIEIEQTGWLKVRFQDDGNDRDSIFPPDNVWLPKKPAATAKPAGQAKPPIRTWTDSTGQFKLEARFVALQDGKLTLEKADGTSKTLPLDKLSEEDQDVAKKLAAKTPAANPFEGSDAAKPPAGGTDSEPANDDDIVAADGDWSSVRNVVVDISSKGQLDPDTAGEPLTQMHSVTMDLTKGAKDRDFSWEQPAGLYYDRSRQRIIVASTNDDRRGGRRSARLEACDLTSGKSLGAVVIGTGIIPCDLSPDGSSVLCMPPGLVSAFHKRRGIEVWRMASGGKLVKRWNPNDTRRKDEMFQIDQAKFISRDLLLTVNTREGKATVWDIDQARAVYTLSIDPQSRPALSANRKQLAVICSGVVCVLDAATGRTLLALTGAGSGRVGRAARLDNQGVTIFTVFAFRSDGCQLAVLRNDHLQIWNLQKQALVQQMWLGKVLMRFDADVVEWLDNNYLLVNRADLLDIAKRIVLWHYEVPYEARAACMVIDGHLGLATSGLDPARGRLQAGISFVALPHAEAAQVAAGLSEERLTALKPGSQVSLDLRFPTPNPQDMDVITASYTEQLKSYNVSVVAGAPLTFQATVEAGKTETKTYRTIGRLGGREETVTSTAQKCRLALMENGKALWERSAEIGGAGFMVSHKEGETLQAAVDKASPQTVANFFRNISLPGCVARQGEHGAYGFSRVTPVGLTAYDPASEPAAPTRGRLGR